MVIGQLRKNNWACPSCRSVIMNNHLFEYTKEYQQRLEDNTKFLKFLKGESNGNG